jgi:hypothetical protein
MTGSTGRQIRDIIGDRLICHQPEHLDTKLFPRLATSHRVKQ